MSIYEKIKVLKEDLKLQLRYEISLLEFITQNDKDNLTDDMKSEFNDAMINFEQLLYKIDNDCEFNEDALHLLLLSKLMAQDAIKNLEIKKDSIITNILKK